MRSPQENDEAGLEMLMRLLGIMKLDNLGAAARVSPRPTLRRIELLPAIHSHYLYFGVKNTMPY